MFDASKARPLRVAVVLIPAAILLHESCSLLPGAPLAEPNGPLPVLLPLLATLAAGALSAGLLSPLLRRSSRAPRCALPILLAGALMAIFLVQEGSEVLLRSGGVGTVGAAFMGLAILMPIALALGVLVAAALVSICRVARAIILRSKPTVRTRRLRGSGTAPARAPRALARGLRPLAFGLARRPPPAPFQLTHA